MKILLLYPRTPSTFWSFSNAVKFVSRKASEIPLGLITVAALLPDSWEVKLIDTNVSPVRDRDILWADYVFLSGMSVHYQAFRALVKRCNELNVPVVAGGPLATTRYREFPGVAHFVLNEAEITLPRFLKDLEAGRPRHVYRTSAFPDLSVSPVPRWDLLRMNDYVSMDIQYSRGCPFQCEFCSITLMNGNRSRVKQVGQFLSELEALHRQGWKGPVFIVDDNFIGNRKHIREDLLPALIQWSRDHKDPFTFTTEVSINLADDDRLIDLMVSAGFRSVFIGIESPHTDSLAECGKHQNRNRDMVAAVRHLQNRGLAVSGGFILGFDHDPPDIFQQQHRFIQSSGIVTAMVGLLNAPKGTRLFKRLKKEKRLLSVMSGDNTDGSINFIPRMAYTRLIREYHRLLRQLYAPEAYYARIRTFLRHYRLPEGAKNRITRREIQAFLKSIWKLGLKEKGKRHYWHLLLFCLVNYPEKFAMAVTMAVYGFHFRRVLESRA